MVVNPVGLGTMNEYAGEANSNLLYRPTVEEKATFQNI
jgi:hypothetical protein